MIVYETQCTQSIVVRASSISEFISVYVFTKDLAQGEKPTSWKQKYLQIFSARQQAERAICYRKSVCLSVRLSITRVDQSKTVERIIEILSPSDRPNILVF